MKKVCKNCHSVCEEVSHAKGSHAMEFILWTAIPLTVLVFLLKYSAVLLVAVMASVSTAFGIIPITYSLFRYVTRYRGCSECKAPYMLPLDSPKGKEITKE